MKKWLVCLLSALFLLAGCSCAPAGENGIPEQSVLCAKPTLLDRAEPWDESGVLKKLPLTHLKKHPDAQVEIIGDELLLWEFCYDNDWISGIRMQVVELDYGRVLAERTVEIKDWIEPQIQDGRICICDNAAGVVTILDYRLEMLQCWQTEPEWNRWIMGNGAAMYVLMDTQILERNLATGETDTVLDRVSDVYDSKVSRDGICLWYTDVEQGQHQTAYLDFQTGTVECPPFRGLFSVSERLGGSWLCRSYLDGSDYRLGDGAQAWDIDLEGGLLRLMPEGYLLEEHMDGNHLYLYDLEGRFLSGCAHSRDGSFMNGVEPVWCEKLGGYLFTVNDMDYTRTNLLLWTLESGENRENLNLTPVDLSLTEEDELELLRRRAEELGETHGLKIWIGGECLTEFDDFTASTLTEPDLVDQQLDILENALEGYPEGFFYQLRHDTYQQIHIQLVSDLMAKPHYGTGGSYGGFMQSRDGFFLVVINTNYAGEGTYYHEFSHIIDRYLEWDSWQREDALYSEDEWLALNPQGFDYTYDYAVIQEFRDDWDQYFIDQYAMINSTEDRARILEYGMLGYMDWRFAEMPGTVEKLRYYAECIRDAFDTEGWPETLLWEQYL